MRAWPRTSSGMVGSSSHVSWQGLERARGADRLVGCPAHVGVHHQWEVRAEMLAHGLHARHVLRQLRAAHFHLDGAEPLLQVVVGLCQQLVQREIQVDAAGVAGHLRVVAAQQGPQRDAEAARLQIPQRDVDSGDGHRRRAATATVVQRPPHLLPQRFDEVRPLAGEPRREIPLHRRVDGRTVGADGEGVARAFRAVLVADAHRHQLEMRHLPVGAVGQRHRQVDQVVVGLDVRDRGHGGLERIHRINRISQD